MTFYLQGYLNPLLTASPGITYTLNIHIVKTNCIIVSQNGCNHNLAEKSAVLKGTLMLTKMSALNVPEADIMRMGGWETDHVMKSVYRHSMMEKDEKAKREAAEKLQNVLFS